MSAMSLNAPDLTPGDFYPDYPAEHGDFGPEHDPDSCPTCNSNGLVGKLQDCIDCAGTGNARPSGT